MGIVDRALRISQKGLVIVRRRQPGCSIGKAVADVWRVHRREKKRQEMRQRIRQVRVDETGCELWETPLGPFWTPSPGGLVTVLVELEDSVYDTSDDAGVGIRRDDVVIDCGAHIGVTCRFALRAGAQKVIAIEVAPDNRACLERNLADEIADGKAVIVPTGVWDSETVLEMHVGAGPLSNTVVQARSQMLRRGDESITVPVTTIDKIVAELGLPRVDFIKMDIEGAERQALRGAHRTLEQHRPRLAIAAYHLPDDRDAIRDAALQGQPAYSEAFGTCLVVHGQVLPETLFYK